MFGFLLLCAGAYAAYWLWKKYGQEKPPEGGGYNGGGGGPPTDWPALPRKPLGTGPVPRYVPDEWVEEYEEYKARLLLRVNETGPHPFLADEDESNP